MRLGNPRDGSLQVKVPRVHDDTVRLPGLDP